jgi:hypothetical protein
MGLSIARFAQLPRRAPRRELAHALLLIVALLVVQLGAFTHALTHFSGGEALLVSAEVPERAPFSEHSNKSHQAEAGCALCSAFAGVASALASAAPLESVAHGTALLARSAVPYCCSPAFLSFSSRAPPAPISV